MCLILDDILVKVYNENIENGTFTFPENIKTIGYGAFIDCNDLKTLVVPISVSRIADCAFYKCTNLESIMIPDTVSSIGDCAFYECISLRSIVIPQSVVNIGYAAFSGCTALMSITIPEVQSIKRNAFDNIFMNMVYVEAPESFYYLFVDALHFQEFSSSFLLK
jgi:hypothetical protein